MSDVRIEYFTDETGFVIFKDNKEVFRQTGHPNNRDWLKGELVAMAEEIASNYREELISNDSNEVLEEIKQDTLRRIELFYLEHIYRKPYTCFDGNEFILSMDNISLLKSLLDIAFVKKEPTVIFYNKDEDPITYSLPMANNVLKELALVLSNVYKSFMEQKNKVKKETNIDKVSNYFLEFKNNWKHLEK